MSKVDSIIAESVIILLFHSTIGDLFDCSMTQIVLSLLTKILLIRLLRNASVD